ncbi:MAG: VOC family protein [Planctomycetes bacterium]|nr:VOC family protein [Planctomycetota bacterium]
MTDKTFSIHLIVNKLEESISFYTEILEFKLMKTRGEPIFFAYLDNNVISLYLSSVGTRGDSLLRKSKGLGAKFQIRILNVDKFYEHVKSCVPFKITQELSEYEFGWKLFSVTDFDGYEWTFYEIID